MATFAAVHRWADEKIKNYIEHPRANYVAEPSAGVAAELRRDAAFGLPANNAEARIAFAEIALEHIQAHEDIRLGPLCFVTIAPSAFAFPVGDSRYRIRPLDAWLRRTGPAATFDTRRLQALARQALGDIPFLGMVEIALFRRWGPARRSRRDWISWHAHLLAWGATQTELTRVLNPLREKYSSLRENSPSAHVQEVPDDDLERQIVYALKAPQKVYRVEMFSRPWTHPVTGVTRPPGLHTQKDWLQTGDRVRLLDIMAERNLDQLLFGNGDGTALARAIRREALTTYRAWECRQPWASLQEQAIKKCI
jgi:hypothetical protein